MLKQLLDSFLQDRKINCCLNHWQGCDEVSKQNLVFKYKTCPFDSWNIIIHRYHTVVDIIMYLGTVKYQVSGQARPGLLVVPCHHCVINLIIPPCLYIITPCLHINSKFQGCSSNSASLDQTAGRCYWLPEPASDIWQRGPNLPLYHQNKLLNMSSTVINTRPGHGCWGWREGGLNLYFHSAVCIVLIFWLVMWKPREVGLKSRQKATD